MTPTANLALWLNAQNLSFAEGPFSASPYNAPLVITQNGEYIVDIYYVNPTFNPSSPWSYIDPTTFTGASVLFGNRSTFYTYVNVTSFTAMVDSYGPKLRFIVSLNSSQLNTDLASAASLVGLIQANWTTATAAPTAQLYAQINKQLGSSAGPAAVYFGSVALSSGINNYTVTGNELPSTPITYDVQIQKLNAGDTNLVPTLRQGYTTDGFIVDFPTTPNANYVLVWTAIYA